MPAITSARGHGLLLQTLLSYESRGAEAKLNVRFLIIQNFFQMAHHLVADFVVAPEPDQLLALRLNGGVTQAIYEL